MVLCYIVTQGEKYISFARSKEKRTVGNLFFVVEINYIRLFKSKDRI